MTYFYLLVHPWSLLSQTIVLFFVFIKAGPAL